MSEPYAAELWTLLPAKRKLQSSTVTTPIHVCADASKAEAEAQRMKNLKGKGKAKAEDIEDEDEEGEEEGDFDEVSKQSISPACRQPSPASQAMGPSQ